MNDLTTTRPNDDPAADGFAAARLDNRTTTAFQVGRTYSTRSVCDHDCIFSITVESRTACFITTTCGKRLKVSEWDGAETVAPEGRYSMCPIINASR